MNSIPAIEVIVEAKRAHILLHPARLQILQELSEPASSSTLAKKLKLPRQRVNYHLRKLESQALVELKEEHVKGSVTERIYQRKGKTFIIAPATLGNLQVNAEEVQDKFSSTYQIARASQIIEDVHQLEQGASAAKQKLSTLSLDVDVRFAAAQDRDAFSAELTEAVQRLAEKYQDTQTPKGRWFKFYFGVYPRPKK